MWYIVGGIGIIVMVFVVWRWTSVGRGARLRDERILKRIDPLAQKIDSGETVSPDDVLSLAKRPETRFMLFTALRELKHPELVPTGFSSMISQAESALAYWLMYPNELQDPPEAIEHICEVKRPLGEQEAAFHVFRYKMPEGHWAAEDGWLLGIAGPMNETAEPYSYLPGAFSRAGDTEGSIQPDALVDWYVEMLKSKGLAT